MGGDFHTRPAEMVNGGELIPAHLMQDQVTGVAEPDQAGPARCRIEAPERTMVSPSQVRHSDLPSLISNQPGSQPRP